MSANKCKTSRNSSRFELKLNSPLFSNKNTNTFRITTSNQQTPRNISTTQEQSLSELRNIQQKTKNKSETQLFWAQMLDNALYLSMQPQIKLCSANDVKNKIYVKLQNMEQQKQLKLKKEQEEREERQRLLLLREAQNKKQMEIKKQKELIALQNKEFLENKYKIDRRFNFFTIVNAAMLYKLHSRIGAFRLSKLLSKHYLNILNYKGVTFRIQEASQAPLMTNFQIKPINQAIQQAQINEIQNKLNEGLLTRRNQPIPKMRHSVRKKTFFQMKATDIFSEKVLKWVRFLQSCFRLKVFRLSKKQLNERKSVEQKAPQISRLIPIKKKMTNVKFLNKSNMQIEKPEEERKHIMGPLALFSTVQKATQIFKNYQRVKSERLFKRTNEYLVKKVQQLYYPMIKYVSVFYKQIVVWSIVYQDITVDKTNIVLFFKGEGRYRYFYRLDIPIGNLNSRQQECITVWPTVMEYLITYLELKGCLALIGNDETVQPEGHKLSFMQGLSLKSRRKITPYDISAIFETKRILNYLQNSQIVRIKKIFGSVYELLPQLKEKIDDQYQLYIVNLPLIHSIVLNLKILEQDRRTNFRYYLHKYQQFITKYLDYIRQHKEIINQIICFRFIQNSGDFYNDQMIDTMEKIQERSVYIQCATINISDCLQFYDLPICHQMSKYALISMNVTCDLQHHIDMLLFNVQTRQSRYFDKNHAHNLFNVSHKDLEWEFKLHLFQLEFQIWIFEKDLNINEDDKKIEVEQKKMERFLTPLQMSIVDFIKIGKALQETLEEFKGQKFDFNKLLKDILMEQQTNNQLFDLVLKNAFTVNFHSQKVIIKPKYLHILSKTHNFIQQMDHQSLYNKTDYVVRYSVFPHEDIVLRRYSKNDQTKFLQTNYGQQFNNLFQQINLVNLRVANEQKQQEVEQVFEQDTNEQLIILQSRRESLPCCRLELFSYQLKCIYKLMGNMKVIIKRNQSVTSYYVDDPNVIQKIVKCQYLNNHQKKSQLIGLMNKIINQTSFYAKKFISNQGTKKYQMPNYNILKLLLISDSKQLEYFLSKVEFIFSLHFNRSTKCYAHVKVFYSSDDNQSQKNRQKKYEFNGEHLFVCLNLFEMNSKMKKYSIVFNKFDLEQMFSLKGGRKQFSFTAKTINKWSSYIVSNLRFNKRFIYRIPFFYKDQQLYSTPQSPIKQIHSMNNKCTMNDFIKYNFDQNVQERKYLNTVHKIFRIIAHYVEKFYLVKIDGQKQLLTEVVYKSTKNPILIQMDFCIITAMVHTQFDLFQLIYYFPRSNRRIMTQLNILHLQEIDFKDAKILKLVEQSYNDYKDLSQFVNKQRQGNLYREKLSLDGNILSRIKQIKKKQQPDNSPSILATPESVERDKKKVGFLQLSRDVFEKNKLIKKSIQQNKEVSDSVIGFLQFTRKLNQDEEYLKLHRLNEIKLWNLFIVQVFQINLKKQNNFNYISLYDKLVESLLDQTHKIRIIGKEYQARRQQMENAQNSFRVRNNLSILYRELMLQNKIKILQPLDIDINPYYLRLHNSDLAIQEYLGSIQFKIERLGSAHVDCFIESVAKIKSYNILKNSEPIPYANSSNYNIYFRYYCLSNYNYRDIRLNLRELLNLFIADGFFKSQTNYMNSKLNRADIQLMCQYITFKIKSQNFLNLPQLALHQPEITDEIQNHIIIESKDNHHQKQTLSKGEGFIYTRVCQKRILLQLQIFPSQKKVSYSSFNGVNEVFRQKDLTYQYIRQKVPFFQKLVKAELYYQALSRLMDTLKIEKK